MQGWFAPAHELGMSPTHFHLSKKQEIQKSTEFIIKPWRLVSFQLPPCCNIYETCWHNCSFQVFCIFFFKISIILLHFRKFCSHRISLRWYALNRDRILQMLNIQPVIFITVLSIYAGPSPKVQTCTYIPLSRIQNEWWWSVLLLPYYRQQNEV